MGTSVNHGSPRTGPSAINWAAVTAAYSSPDVPLGRLIQEIWRAAQSDEDSSWRALLKADGVTFCLRAIERADTPERALSAASREIIQSRQSSLASDVAKRALVQAYLVGDDPRRGFAEALFSQVTDYLVSRDLPGYIGKEFRNPRVSNAIEFKDRIRDSVRQRVAGLVTEYGLRVSAERPAWRRLVDRVVSDLSG